MPELPEVEVLKQDLLKQMPKPACIVSIKLLASKLRTPLILPPSICGQPLLILGIKRRSKYLILQSNKGILLSHLGMSGRWRIEKKFLNLKHDHVVMTWQNGDFWVYNDPRRFGIFEYYSSEEKVKWFDHLGPEPLSDGFVNPQLIAKIRGSDRAIKSIIMDAKVMVGVGNIYASEALYSAGINPFKKGSKVSEKKIEELLIVIRETLLNAIEGGGSSIRDYVHSDGDRGHYQNQHRVYAREHQLCFKCQNKIKAKKIQGRSTFWCNKCQH